MNDIKTSSWNSLRVTGSKAAARFEVVGVLNVISTYKNAFSPADRTYIELLGSILSVAWSLVEEEDGDG